MSGRVNQAVEDDASDGAGLGSFFCLLYETSDNCTASPMYRHTGTPLSLTETHQHNGFVPQNITRNLLHIRGDLCTFTLNVLVREFVV